MDFKLPELGEGVHEGEMVKWRVQPGDKVRFDQPLCEIMTDKATIEIPSPLEGTVTALQAREGEIVHVGQVLIVFEGGQQTVSIQQEDKKPIESIQVQKKPVIQQEGAIILAAPSTRRFAREQGVELVSVVGSGPAGRVLREDVEKMLQHHDAVEPAFTTVPFRGLRKKIAEKMRQSKDHAAHFTYVEEADVSELVRVRRELKEAALRDKVKVTFVPFVMKAMAQALKRVPSLNGTLDEARGEIKIYRDVHIGLSIQTEDGLVAPVIRDVQSKSILTLAREVDALAQKARQKKLTREDVHGSTITLTNIGSIGGLFATPVINYPEVAIVGLNKIARRPVVVDEAIVIRDWTYFSISLDHRVIDGAIGAEYLKEMIMLLEKPHLLLLGA